MSMKLQSAVKVSYGLWCTGELQDPLQIKNGISQTVQPTKRGARRGGHCTRPDSSFDER